MSTPPKNRRSMFLQMLKENRRAIAPARHHPRPLDWNPNTITATCLGHSTILLDFFGLKILTDPILGSHAGLRFGPLKIGTKRLIAPALTVEELPPLDLILLSHAHMDHLDTWTLKHIANRQPDLEIIAPRRTADLFRGTKFTRIHELDWGESLTTHSGHSQNDSLTASAFEVRHWGARMSYDTFRGYNGYILERNDRRIIFVGDTAFTPRFSELRTRGATDLIFMPIGAYHPWIAHHCTPEEAVAMADLANAHFVFPMHHQTFKLSWEPLDEPIRRFEKALAPERQTVREIGETFVFADCETR